MSFLDDSPPDFSKPEWRELLNLLAGRIYNLPEIELVLLGADISPGDVDRTGSARLVWFNSLKTADGKLKMEPLIEEIREQHPNVGERIDDELLGAKTVVQAAGPDQIDFVGFGKERQIVEGDETLLDIAFLELGLRKAASVCRITATFSGGSYHGSGFRIDADTLLTNHHVLYDWDDGDKPAVDVVAWFGYELDAAGKRKGHDEVVCDPASMRGDKANDWAIVRVTDPIPDRYPAIELEPPKKPVEKDDRVYIIQHPSGTRKKIGLHHNLVRCVDDDVLQYWTDTEQGSSGSPVFNRDWEVVGLHHYWVTTQDDDHAFANQGRRIERVLAGINSGG